MLNPFTQIKVTEGESESRVHHLNAIGIIPANRVEAAGPGREDGDADDGPHDRVSGAYWYGRIAGKDHERGGRNEGGHHACNNSSKRKPQ